jgi:DNA polymerase-1
MKRLVLIDGHAILHRAYYAFPATLRTHHGEVVNAVYGFTRMLLMVLQDLHPEYVAVAFDLPQPTFRHKEFIGYQAQRPKMDTELENQIERVFEVVKTLNIPMFMQAGYEADDLIGTLANQASQKKIETVIVTGDKDLLQLVKPRIKIYAPQKGFSEAILFDQKKVKAMLGIKPEQVIDYKALVGDASDNYPGVPGIGPKTALELLHQYQDLKTIYKKMKKIKPKTAKLLREGKESAILSQKLATIVTKAPIKLNLKACRLHDYDQEKAMRLFQELGFKSLLKKLPGVKSKTKKKKEKNQQMELLQ